jgi:hypothetical protein
MTDLSPIDGNILEGVSATTLRARAFDTAAQDYPTAHPKASVVALAEETRKVRTRARFPTASPLSPRDCCTESGRIR